MNQKKLKIIIKPDGIINEAISENKENKESSGILKDKIDNIKHGENNLFTIAAKSFHLWKCLPRKH